ncbi:annexin A1-like [Archocentrus centrarchus]|uniref:annexin A1-like n=1 Tax=Archocentrus centrarchus TaxID=63155 RepID=UPI0011EA490C|nr:annexin A1-like [Archocentrus centrarchus]XP_030598963.1 annexin A1-like [Archocentrus centrarchus]XP_030598964.1 annexin A1-like [Archocentrus centrarchus]
MPFFDRLKDIFSRDRDSDRDTVEVKDKEKPKYYGTVTPYPYFNASSDAAVLRSAIERKGVDEDVIITVLVKRSNEQRQKIKEVYEMENRKKLDEDLKSVMRADLKDICLALLMAPAHFDAYQLRKATKSLGTDEEVLTEILATRTNQEIQEIKRAFNEDYKTDLEDVIKSETSGHFTNILLALLLANRDESTNVDRDLVAKDTRMLVKLCENGGKFDVPTFTDMMTKRSYPHLSKVLEAYGKQADVKLPTVLKKELKGDTEECLIDLAKFAWNTPAVFAQKLVKAMEKPDTSEKTLNRILVSRSEVDLQKIKEVYWTYHKRSLQEDLQKHTKEHYQKVLLSLCGAF